MFSATLKGAVMNLSKRLLRNPLEINVVPEVQDCENIEQRLHYVDNIQHKQELLEHLLTDPSLRQTIVFTATKRNADDIAEKLCEIGHSAAALHGDMNQRQRTRTVKRLRLGEIKVLVATDVAARGIDLLTISHVINFDLPKVVEDYVHRIGRTGRAGGKGVALSFASHKDRDLLRQIEFLTKKKMTTHTIPGMEPKGKSGHSHRPPPQRFRGHSQRPQSQRSKARPGRFSR